MISSDTSFRVLLLCARRPGDGAIGDRLRTALERVRDWNALALDAEEHGVEPLLLEHARECGIALPPETDTQLKTRCMQHAHAAAVRVRILGRVLHELDAASVPTLILKGAALAHLVYPSPRLRPVRDVDLLVGPPDAARAWRLLQQNGFSRVGPHPGSGHHHLHPLAIVEDDATITIEVHRAALAATPFVPPLRYEDLSARSQTFALGDRVAQTLGREDMLWHAYAHGFLAPLLRPATRAISIADLVFATEAWVDRLDWDRLRRVYPRLVRALRRIGQMVAWSPHVEARLGPSPAGVSRPRDWWFDVRYGVDGAGRRLWHQLTTHPATLALVAADAARHRYAGRLRQ
jgi:Uncharacterised nucleotidyltransferase